MSSLEDFTVQNPVEIRPESSHFNPANPDLTTLTGNQSYNLSSSSKKLNIKAIISLVISIVGILIPFLSFVAIPVGIYAKQEIGKGKSSNNVIATIGITIGTIVTVAYVLYAYSKFATR